MILLNILCLIPIILCAIESDNQIRGVPFSRIALFKPTGPDNKHFTCFDGSRTILYSQLNDDYCDCEDGSDEPGTSACRNSKFFCSNVGHKSGYIPSNRVNDGICDCCDGSDEYNGAVTCANICEELGRAAKVEKERRSEMARRGYQKRQLLSKEGISLREEKLNGMEPLKAEKSNMEPELKRLEENKKKLEEIEEKLKNEHRDKWMKTLDEKKKVKSLEMFKNIDKNEDQKISLDELKALKYLDSDNNGEVSDEEAKSLSTQEEIDYNHFHSNLFDRLQDLLKSSVDKIEEELKSDADDDVLGDDVPSEDHEDQMPAYTADIQTAIDAASEARRQYDEVNNKYRDIENKIKESEDFSNFDYGSDYSWVALKGKCFERNVQQYTYSFCPFGSNLQKDGGYGGVNLGTFKRWDGPENDKYSKQLYEDGQQCWNGPKRSTQVTIECGEEHDLAEVTEPAKCEYYYLFKTPLACNDPDKEPAHEEL